MTTNANNYNELMNELSDQLNKAYGTAIAAKMASEPNSKDMRKLMYLTSALESIMLTLQEN